MNHRSPRTDQVGLTGVRARHLERESSKTHNNNNNNNNHSQLLIMIKNTNNVHLKHNLHNIIYNCYIHRHTEQCFSFLAATTSSLSTWWL